MSFIAKTFDYLNDLATNEASQLDADIVVIGSGAGGSVVAATAAEQGRSVLILEEGPYVPANQVPQRTAELRSSLWRHGGLTTAYGPPSISYGEGRCVGGSTEISHAIFQRIPGFMLAEWHSRYRIKDFGMLAMAPYYEWALNLIRSSQAPRALGVSNEILARSGNAMRWETRALETGEAESTVEKPSMSLTLIPRILSQGHRLLADTKVKRIVMQGRSVNYIEAVTRQADGRKQRLRIKANKVFLCAGAIQTPALLQNAGFHGIIGRHLRLHPTLTCMALFDKIIDAQHDRVPLATVTEFMPNFQLGGTQFTPSVFGQTVVADWQQRSHYINQPRQAALYQAMVCGKGSGRIFAMPNGAAPIVTYKLDDQDWQNLGLGAAKLGQALLQMGAGIVFPSISGHAGWQAPHEANEDSLPSLSPKTAQISSLHLFGSCPMGENTEYCGADSFGRVHGANNLYVADASLIPEATGVHPQATVMALARRIALHVLDT